MRRASLSLLLILLWTQLSFVTPLAKAAASGCISVAGELLYYPGGQYAQDLHLMYSKHLQPTLGQLRSIFSAELGEITGRSKVVESIISKLKRKQWARQAPLADIEEAKAMIGDGLGSRLTLAQPASEEKIKLLVDQISDGIQSGYLQVTEIHNYRAPGVLPYLSDEQVQLIANFSERLGHPISITIGDNAIRESGYTGLHLNLIHSTSDGVIRGEMQIRGQMVGKLARVEHFLYDVRRLKISADELETAGLKRIYSVYTKLTEDQARLHQGYLQQLYAHARQVEMTGVELAKPKLPSALTKYPELDINFLERELKQK